MVAQLDCVVRGLIELENLDSVKVSLLVPDQSEEVSNQAAACVKKGGRPTHPSGL